MIYPEADKIEKNIDSKYALVILAAKRARLIKEGARPLTPTTSTNPLTISLEEIAHGKVNYKFDEDSLAGREALADKQAVVGKRDLEVEGLDPLATPDDALALAAAQLGAGDYLEEEDADASDGEAILRGADDEEEEEDAIFLGEDTEEAEV